MDTACSSRCSQCMTSKVCPANQSSSRKNSRQFIMRWIIPRNFDSAWAHGFLRRHNLITLNHSFPWCTDRRSGKLCCRTVRFRVAKYSACSPKKLWTEGILWALREILHIKWSGKLSLFFSFWNGALCMHVGMFVKNPCLLSGFTSFPLSSKKET